MTLFFELEQVAKAAKVYSEQLRQEVNAEREKLGKKPIDDNDDDGDSSGGTAKKVVSTTEPVFSPFYRKTAVFA